MDGITCARRIGEVLDSGAHSPMLLMLSAFSQDEVLTRVEEQGVQIRALLTKPVTPSTLFEAWCKAIGLGPQANVQAERRKEASQNLRSKLHNARILLVEDNPINREVAVELLSEQGITVVTASEGREALAVLEREQFDAVLMDCQLPVMDGFAATRALRQRPALQDLPVIAMTANAMAGDRERTREAGMNDNIAKPIDIDEMFATLARWIVPRRQTAASAAANGAPTNLPSLPGVDVTAALARMGSKEVLFAKTLRRFLEAQRDFVARFASTWVGGDTAAARRMAHDLQSVAGMLGVDVPREAAIGLELACSADEASAVNAHLQEVTALIKPILQGTGHEHPA
jgi:CheY-like chemotaxis protein